MMKLCLPRTVTNIHHPGPGNGGNVHHDPSAPQWLSKFDVAVGADPMSRSDSVHDSWGPYTTPPPRRGGSPKSRGGAKSRGGP